MNHLNNVYVGIYRDQEHANQTVRIALPHLLHTQSASNHGSVNVTQ
jgi:hypothetical protein